MHWPCFRRPALWPRPPRASPMPFSKPLARRSAAPSRPRRRAAGRDRVQRGGRAPLQHDRGPGCGRSAGRLRRGPRRARRSEAAQRRAQAATARHLQGDLARDLGRHAQDRGLVRLHGEALNTPFDVTLALARGASVAASLSLFGALLFRCVIAPDPAAPALRRCSALSLAAALAIGAAGVRAGGGRDRRRAQPRRDGRPAVAGGFRDPFGHVLLARLGLLLATAAVLLRLERGRPWAAAAAAGSRSRSRRPWGTRRRWAARPAPGSTATEALHVLAAGAWLAGSRRCSWCCARPRRTRRRMPDPPCRSA